MATFTEKNGYRRKKWMWLRGKRRVKDRSVFCRHAALFTKPRCAGRSAPALADNFPGSDAYYNYVLTLFGKAGINTVSASRQKVSYYLTGPGMRKFTLNIFTLSLGLAVSRWSRQHQPLSNSCWSKFG